MNSFEDFLYFAQVFSGGCCGKKGQHETVFFRGPVPLDNIFMGI